MNISLETLSVPLLAKLTILLAAAWIAQAVLWRRNPRWQVGLWRLTVAGVCALLITAAIPPLYSVSLWHAPSDRAETPLTEQAAESPTSAKAKPQAVKRRHVIEDEKAKRATQKFYPNDSRPQRVARPSAPLSRALPASSPESVSNEQIVAEIEPETVPAAAVEAPSQWKINWARCGLVLYFSVFGGLIFRQALGLFAIHRTRQQAVIAPDWVRIIAQDIARQFGCRQIAVRVTQRLASPALVGVFRPTILLPQTMLDGPPVEQDVRGAVAHEMAHVAGNDLVWDRLLAVLVSFVWPHPLVWSMRAIHRSACERVSDRMAADAIGDLVAYQGLLARIALQVATAQPRGGLAMARQPEVRRRLSELINGPAAQGLGRRAAIVAVSAMCAVIALGVGSPLIEPVNVHAATDQPVAENALAEKAEAKDNEKQIESPVRSRPEELRFQVFESQEKEPLAGAKLTVRMYDAKPNVTRKITTDDKGVATFKYDDGERPVYLWVMVHKPGYVPYYVSFGRNLIPEALPTDKTIFMDRGKKVGGEVVDLEGNPVAGATVSILVPATDTPSEIHYHLLHEKTAADGLWELDGAPMSLAGIHLRVEHPEFLQSSHSVQDRADGRYEISRGLSLSGRVTDTKGNPIPTAKITVGRDRWGNSQKPTSVIDKGTYEIHALKAQSTWVTAEAPGFSPQVKAIELNEETKPVNFGLEPGHTTRFLIVNTSGKPLKGISIVADTWNGFRTLWWRGKSNAEGEIVWNGAPAEAVEYDLIHKNYAARRNVVVSPQEEPHVVVMRKPLRIQGIVTDSNSKKVPEFHVELGVKFPGRQDITWLSHDSSTGRNGKFEIKYNEDRNEVYLRIEAQGMLPWKSEAIPFQDPEHKVFVRLQPGAGPAGIVWSPQGEPVAGARVTLVTKSEGMQFTSDYRTIGGKQTVTSDKTGRFQFLALDEDALLVAVHESGYSEVTKEEVAEAGGIKLQAWARVEATVKQNGQPVSGARVSVSPEWQREHVVRVFSYGIRGTTDEEGRVVFNRIVPRNVTVSKNLEQPIGSGTTVYSERFAKAKLAPGDSAHVELGGTGSAVKGRFVVAGTPPSKHVWKLNRGILLKSIAEKADPLEKRYYRCLINKDGSFRVEDIPPGRYNLRVDLTAAPQPNVCGHGETMGRIVKEIEIGQDVPVVDLGVIEGTWFERLDAGDKAPRFVVQGIGQKDLRLDDFRGRLALLDFWATWCKPCLAEMPELAKIHYEFAEDDRFEIVGLSVDNTLDEATATVERNDWPWKNAFAGPGRSATVPRRYDVKSLPDKFLIDVDGTILYRGRDLGEITELVRKRLAELPAEIAAPAIAEHGVRPEPIDDRFQPSQPIALAVVNSNINYKLGTEPSLKGPGLMLWSQDGEPIRQLSDLGTSGWLTGPRRLALDVKRDRLYYCDTLNRRLVAIDRHGQQLFATNIPDLHAVTVDQKTGDLWCLTLGNLSSGELLVLDANGREKTWHPLTAYGLAFSPVDDAFWVAGKTIQKISREGKVLSSHPLPAGAYTYTNVVVDPKRGGAWVIEDDHPDVPRSKNRLWKVDSNGSAKIAHTFPKKVLPRTLVCVDGEPWLAVLRNYESGKKDGFEYEIQRFDHQGALEKAIDLPATDITVGVQVGTIWIRTKESILQIDRKGNITRTLPFPKDTNSVQMVAF